MPEYQLIILFFIIAFLYSSVGFGGGSSYLAVMALFDINYQILRIVALLCNITVVTGGVFIFWKNGYIKWKKILPLVLLSVPLAFLGGRTILKEEIFFVLAGISLCIIAILMFVIKVRNEGASTGDGTFVDRPLINGSIGGAIGYFSGLIGIGGGIFLSPLLHLIKWDQAKYISATASIFILVNSVSGLMGQFSVGLPTLEYPFLASLILAVFIGGQLGSRAGVKLFSDSTIRIMTAMLVLFVGIRLLYRYV